MQTSEVWAEFGGSAQETDIIHYADNTYL